MAVDQKYLDGFVGKGMKDICGNGFSDAGQNHCAHFVSHALGLQVGYLCSQMKKGPAPGASIRCDELFNGIASRGAWSDDKAAKNAILVFVTDAGNVQGNIMAQVPRKHVGIVWAGAVYNYGNTLQAVRKEASVADFLTRMKGAYHKDSNVSLFYAEPPPSRLVG